MKSPGSAFVSITDSALILDLIKVKAELMNRCRANPTKDKDTFFWLSRLAQIENQLARLKAPLMET